LIIPGPLPPDVLGAELVINKNLECQYCYQSHCPKNIDFACMDVKSEIIIEMANSYFLSGTK